MKLMHLGDLHLGKRVNGFSMLEDQRYILNQILDIMTEEQPQAVLIAGDVYDKPIPPAEAVRLMDDFLTEISSRGVQAYLISGNHDSAERVAFGHHLMARSGIHISPVYDGSVMTCSAEDEWGKINFHLIPYVRPSVVRNFSPDAEIENYTDAMNHIVAGLKLTPEERHVAIAHQFVTGSGMTPETCDSEQLSVGGLDQVDAAAFRDFDYVALGHLHGPQRISRDTIRYAGSPLKYSFSELHQKKSVTMVELREKGNTIIRQIPLKPLREMKELRGTFREILAQGEQAGTAVADYYHIILTDENDVVDALSQLREYYPNTMLLDYDNVRTRSQRQVEQPADAEEKTPEELFALLYEQQNGQEMNPEQQELVHRLIREIWERD
jgi:DNA repair protein SbcD/Mre11